MPVALHAVTSPEEHRQRYLIAKEVISNFRRQLQAAMAGKPRNFWFDKASRATKGDLRYIFDAIERLNTGGVSLSKQEIHNCIYSGRFNRLLFKLASNKVFYASRLLEDAIALHPYKPPART